MGLEIPVQDQASLLLWASGGMPNGNGRKHMASQTSDLMAKKQKPNRNI
jgi:hypothetical protein